MTFRDALRLALTEELERDPTVMVLGEDVADPLGGSYRVTLGLSTRFGAQRIRNTPISETAIVGAGIGAALVGLRPVVEVMYMDFLELAMDQVVSQAAKARYMSGGQVRVPMVVRCQGGPGRAAAAQHSQLLEAWFAHVPGLKVVVPSTPADARGLLKSAIRDDNPVIFFESNLLYNVRGEVPQDDADTVTPLGTARLVREGTDITVVTWGAMVHDAIAAAEQAHARWGVSAEVLDLRTISPWDREAVLASFRKTGSAVVAHQAVRQGGVGAEIAATLYEEALDYADAEIARVGAAFAPTPFSPELERIVVPGADQILDAIVSTQARRGG